MRCERKTFECCKNQQNHRLIKMSKCDKNANFHKIMRILSNLNEKICSNRRIYLQTDEKNCQIYMKNETNEIYEFV